MRDPAAETVKVLFKAWVGDDWGDNGEPTPAVLVCFSSTNLTAPLRLPAKRW